MSIATILAFEQLKGEVETSIRQLAREDDELSRKIQTILGWALIELRHLDGLAGSHRSQALQIMKAAKERQLRAAASLESMSS